jgi:hypothetical protein
MATIAISAALVGSFWNRLDCQAATNLFLEDTPDAEPEPFVQTAHPDSVAKTQLWTASPLRTGVSRMKITDWCVWHTYATFLHRQPQDLAQIAAKLVKTGTCELAFRPDGRIWWYTERECKSTTLDLAKLPFHARMKFSFPVDLNDFVQLCLLEGVGMALFGKHLFEANLPEHIRLYMRPCIFERDDINALVYPQITLYEDGVILLAFKILSGERMLDTAQFVNSVVNFPLREANSARIPATLLRKFLLLDQVRTGSFLCRMLGVFGHLQNPIEKFIRYYEYNEVDLGSSRRYFSVRKEWVSEAGRSEGSALTLRGLSERIEDVIAWVALPRLDRATGAIRRRDPLPPLVGGTWVGRPEIHLIDYDTKPSAKSTLSDATKQGFACILARTEAPLSTDSIERFLGARFKEV